MALQALLLSHDSEVQRILQRVLQNLGMSVEVCTSSEKASEWLERRKCDVAIVDLDDVPGAAAVLHEVGQSSSNRDTLTVALLSGASTPHQAFELGGRMSLQKPLTLDRATKAFRAAHVIMMGERRRYYRYPVDMPVTITVEKTEILGTATDISAGGMAVHVPLSLAANAMVELRFQLPGSKVWVGTGAVVAWADQEGHAGLRFERMPFAAREEFDRWTAEQEKATPPSSVSPTSQVS